MTLQFRNFLVPLDGSELAEKALPYALSLAESCGATLHLLSVAEGNPDTLERIVGFTWLGQERRIEEEEMALQAYQEALVARISAETSQSIRTSVEDGDVTATILKYAADNQCDAIIMATRGRSDLAQIVMGSTAEDLVRDTSTPVMLVR